MAWIIVFPDHCRTTVVSKTLFLISPSLSSRKHWIQLPGIQWMWDHQEEKEILPGLSICEVSGRGHAERRSALHRKSLWDCGSNDCSGWFFFLPLRIDRSLLFGRSSELILKTVRRVVEPRLCCTAQETMHRLAGEVPSPASPDIRWWWRAPCGPADSSET